MSSLARSIGLLPPLVSPVAGHGGEAHVLLCQEDGRLPVGRGIVIRLAAFVVKRRERISPTTGLALVFAGVSIAMVEAILFEGLSPDPIYVPVRCRFPDRGIRRSPSGLARSVPPGVCSVDTAAGRRVRGTLRSESSGPVPHGSRVDPSAGTVHAPARRSDPAGHTDTGNVRPYGYRALPIARVACRSFGVAIATQHRFLPSGGQGPSGAERPDASPSAPPGRLASPAESIRPGPFWLPSRMSPLPAPVGTGSSFGRLSRGMPLFNKKSSYLVT